LMTAPHAATSGRGRLTAGEHAALTAALDAL
jgi:hypothetical protein